MTNINQAAPMEQHDDLRPYEAADLKAIFEANPERKLKAMLELDAERFIPVTVVAFNKGWATAIDADGTEHKVRAGSLYPVESEGARNMSSTLRKYRERYVPTVANSGKKSLHCGDSVAEALEYLALEDLYEIAGQILEGWTAETLRERYKHLNIGSQRMNIGNRIRAAYKRGDEAVVQWVEDNLGEK